MFFVILPCRPSLREGMLGYLQTRQFIDVWTTLHLNIKLLIQGGNAVIEKGKITVWVGETSGWSYSLENIPLEGMYLMIVFLPESEVNTK